MYHHHHTEGHEHDTHGRDVWERARLSCWPWCGHGSDAGAASCPRCGAPVDVRMATDRFGVGGVAADQGHGQNFSSGSRFARSKANTFRWRIQIGGGGRGLFHASSFADER